MINGSNARMTDKKSTQIAKYQALMSLAVNYAEDLTAKIRYQHGMLKSLGVTDGDILNFDSRSACSRADLDEASSDCLVTMHDVALARLH